MEAIGREKLMCPLARFPIHSNQIKAGRDGCIDDIEQAGGIFSLNPEAVINQVSVPIIYREASGRSKITDGSPPLAPVLLEPT
jgi:hypothetical protein